MQTHARKERPVQGAGANQRPSRRVPRWIARHSCLALWEQPRAGNETSQLFAISDRYEAHVLDAQTSRLSLAGKFAGRSETKRKETDMGRKATGYSEERLHNAKRETRAPTTRATVHRGCGQWLMATLLEGATGCMRLSSGAY